MAKIVLGLGSSHTPLFTLDSTEWEHRADADRANTKLNTSDGRWLDYATLLHEVGPRYEGEAAPAELERKAILCEQALDHLAAALKAAAPDVVVIVGDDQGEMFGPDNQPAFAIFHADKLDTSDMYGHEGSPEWIRKMGLGYMMDARHVIPGDADFALRLIDGLMANDVDVCSVATVGHDAREGLGHAFGFIVKRLFGDAGTPIVPIMLNTYFPPNVPSARRCYDIGVALRRAIEADGSDKRVAVVASGGLSHFVVDEELDRRVMRALAEQDDEVLRSLRRGELNSGSSEILNWVMAGGVLEGLPVKWSQYVPLYRTPAGTGVGAGFMIWQH
jgi:hypothetical protein